MSGIPAFIIIPNAIAASSNGQVEDSARWSSETRNEDRAPTSPIRKVSSPRRKVPSSGRLPPRMPSASSLDAPRMPIRKPFATACNLDAPRMPMRKPFASSDSNNDDNTPNFPRRRESMALAA